MRRLIGFLCLVLSATGCSAMGAADLQSGGFGAGEGDFGATPGGVQDLNFARGLVKEGRVPPPEAILVEAMFSEHDLPLAGAPCAETLCLRGAVGVAPNGAGAEAAWAQIGLSSTIDPETFERPPLAVVATVDISGSMGWGYGDNNTPGELARGLLTKISTQLDQNDLFSMVTYGTGVSTPLGWTNGADPSIAQAIKDLHEDGSTNMEAGLVRAFDMADDLVGQGYEVRLLLFTDEQPNVGATSGSEFEKLVGDGAESGVGITIFGLGLGLGAEVMKGMAHLRGGNAFSLVKPADIDPFMEQNWPWCTVPIAYDLSVAVQATQGMVLTTGYGFPETAAGKSTSLDVSSVFLSKRRGGLLLELGVVPPHKIAQGDGITLQLSYEDPKGEAHSETLNPTFSGSALDERGVSMPAPGISRAVSLAIFTSAMREATEEYQHDRALAADMLATALDRLSADAAASNDDDLSKEAEFWAKLLTLMEQLAPQGDLYGGYDN